MPAAPVTSFVQKKIPNPFPAPRMVAKGIHYRSDGSGRDSYVICNEGGFAHQPSFIQVEEQFRRSLRKHELTQSAYKKTRLAYSRYETKLLGNQQITA